MSYTLKFSMAVGSTQKVGNSDEKGWREGETDCIIPNGRGISTKIFTFACSSIPGIAWLADAVVSSNSIEA